MTLTFETEADDFLVKIATRLGVTKSAVAQWLIETVELDSRGVPLGWPESDLDDGELPIDTA